MQEAGYILLMPGGDWNADTTYHILHLVNHNGASWLCKVEECTGQEPSDSNTEFWQRFGTAVDLSNYLPKSGGTIDGDVTISSSEALGRGMFLANSLKKVGVQVTTDGRFVLYDQTNGKNILTNAKDGTNSFNGTASGNLPINGDTLNEGKSVYGKVNGNASNAVWNGYRNNDGTVFGGVGAFASNGVISHIFIGADGETSYRKASGLSITKDAIQWKEKDLLHTGNKPTGSYTGNGSATARTVNVGGVGLCIFLRSHNGASMIVGYNGAFGVDSTGADVKFCANEINFRSGVITIASTHKYLNASGITQEYQQL